ncbi:MAG TPA: ribosome maturation factor RimP [Nitrospirae bacterium]|nr:ribosome maturation factor RimP [Nitrospirota bacterium]HDO21949.1 ribosome maturation factor RimP [Nitrospirota bacterium]HDZ88967.1 ribosome maturation factor RimP [Nitrospirota bacterium]
MPKKELINKLMLLAESVAEDNGVEAVDVELLGSGRRTILRVTIDKESGVSLKDCQSFSRDFESLLDVEDPIPGNYTLEVTSPGIDRPLKKIEDFVKYNGKKVRIVCRDKIENQSFFQGYIRGIEGQDILVEINGKTVTIPFESIKKASLEIEF